MAPLPKRKHSTKRTGERVNAGKLVKLPKLVECNNCHKRKLPHRICKHCGK